MRLEPVYLVAPEPEPPKIPTRRAFLLAGATFAAGLTLGGACGYAAGSSANTSVQTGEGEDDVRELESTGNAELDELRRLAVKAPIEELAEKWLYFLQVSSKDYRHDEVLPRGVERLAKYILATPDLDQRKLIANATAQVIELGEQHLQDRAIRYVPQLRRVR